MINGFLRSQNPSHHRTTFKLVGVNRFNEADPSGAFSGVQILVRRPALRMPH